jgi:hypothetical protein
MMEQAGKIQAFHKHRFTDPPMEAIHIGWERLSLLFSGLLSDLLGRGIKAESRREEPHRWKTAMASTPLGATELEALLDLAGASDWNREENGHGEGLPILETGQGICGKLMGKLLPFGLAQTCADGEGIWFIGGGALSPIVGADTGNAAFACPAEGQCPSGYKIQRPIG